LRADIPGVFARYSDRFRELASDTINGQQLRVLELAWSPELTMRYWVHPENHRVLQSECRLSSGGMNMAFLTRYDDFRTEQGVLLAHREENWAGASHVATTRIQGLRFQRHEAETFSEPGMSVK
jgi:hypothetical protein